MHWINALALFEPVCGACALLFEQPRRAGMMGSGGMMGQGSDPTTSGFGTSEKSHDVWVKSAMRRVADSAAFASSQAIGTAAKPRYLAIRPLARVKAVPAFGKDA
jgi:hypothetical protein